jgi:hypothetical protein
MLDASPARVAWLASNVTLATLAIGYGLWACWRRILPRAGAESRSPSPAGGNQPPGPGFPVAAFAVAFFPIILMKHISEIYLTGVTLGLALLIGLSAHGWTTVSRPLRYAALFLFAVQLCLAAQAVRGKVAGINEAGERADAMVRQLLNQIPDDSTARTIAMVFVESAAVGGKGYSVFALPDDQLVPTGYGTFAIKWFRPDLDIRLDPKIVADPSDVDDESYDLVLLWEPSTGRFRRLASPAAVP